MVQIGEKWGTKMQKMRKELKNENAKHGLNLKRGIMLIGLSILRDQTRREERRRGEEEEEGEEEKKKRREEEEGGVKQKGMELHGILKFCMNFHA